MESMLCLLYCSKLDVLYGRLRLGRLGTTRGILVSGQ
jgi:hypothetical protein